MLSNSPEVDTLRLRTLNGNKDELQGFCRAIRKLLENVSHHPIAYEQINQLLISGQTDVVNEIDRNIMPAVA